MNFWLWFRFSICNIQTGLSRDKRSWGQFLTDDLDIFSTTGEQGDTLSVAVLNNVNGFLVFSHFKKPNSTSLQQDQKAHET